MIMQSGSIENPAGHRFYRAPGFPCWTLAMILRGRIRLAFGRRTIASEPGCFVAHMPNTSWRFVADTPMHEAWCLATLRPSCERLSRSRRPSWPSGCMPRCPGRRIFFADKSGSRSRPSSEVAGCRRPFDCCSPRTCGLARCPAPWGRRRCGCPTAEIMQLPRLIMTCHGSDRIHCRPLST